MAGQPAMFRMHGTFPARKWPHCLMLTRDKGRKGPRERQTATEKRREQIPPALWAQGQPPALIPMFVLAAGRLEDKFQLP